MILLLLHDTYLNVFHTTAFQLSFSLLEEQIIFPILSICGPSKMVPSLSSSGNKSISALPSSFNQLSIVSVINTIKKTCLCLYNSI